tara:strand:- start:183 stop:701 length:519 start_codon:yes stop_codon:yes gene_type:complete
MSSYKTTLKTYTAVSGGSDLNPHVRVGLRRNWVFANFQEEVDALIETLTALKAGPAYARLPRKADEASAEDVANARGTSGFTFADLANMNEADVAKLIAALGGNGGTEKMAKAKPQTKTRTPRAFRVGDSVKVRGSRHAFKVTATREGEVQVKRADGVGNRRWYAAGRVSAR